MPTTRILQSPNGTCRYHGQNAGLSRRILRFPERFTSNLALVLAAVAVTACAPPMPTATPTPTPTPTPAPAVEETLAELFWISVDWVGDVSQTPKVNRTLNFETAKSVVKDFLFRLYIENFNTLKEHGIAPYETFPYCLDFISGTLYIGALIKASSPAEAAPHVNDMIETLHRMERDITLIREGEGGGRQNKTICDQFEAEKREVMGLSPLNGQ